MNGSGARLFYRPGTGRPLRVAWTLEELGVAYQPIRVAEEHEGHPMGRVPVLEFGGERLFESTALCLQLADLHPDAGLIPPPGTAQRGQVYQWTLFAMTELERPVSDFLRFRASDPGWAASGRERFAPAAAVLEETVPEADFLVGGHLTVADIVTGGVLALARLSELLGEYPNLDAYSARLAERDSFRRAALATESIVKP